MQLIKLKGQIPDEVYKVLEKRGIIDLRPCQIKAIEAGLFKRKNLLICTPTASGKTLVAELAALESIIKGGGKAIYIVPLKALANEKFKSFKEDFGHLVRVALSIGDLDEKDPYLANFDLIVCTSEKLDSLLRHRAEWLNQVKTVIIDEIHLLNDVSRGPTLEVIITLMRKQIKDLQIVGLSATIGNPSELAEWLRAELVLDTWRPVELREGIFREGTVRFYN